MVDSTGRVVERRGVVTAVIARVAGSGVDSNAEIGNAFDWTGRQVFYLLVLYFRYCDKKSLRHSLGRPLSAVPSLLVPWDVLRSRRCFYCGLLIRGCCVVLFCFPLCL